MHVAVVTARKAVPVEVRRCRGGEVEFAVSLMLVPSFFGSLLTASRLANTVANMRTLYRGCVRHVRANTSEDCSFVFVFAKNVRTHCDTLPVPGEIPAWLDPSRRTAAKRVED